MENVRLNIRLAFMLVFTLALLMLMGGRLLNPAREQTPGEPAAQNPGERLTISYTSVPSARGELLDRYGRPLIENNVSVALMLDAAELFGDPDRTESLAGLADFARRLGVRPRDTLPVSAAPYVYAENAPSSQTNQLERFLEKKKLQKDIDARELMALLREEYGIPAGISEEQARELTGVLYEIECRVLFTTVRPYSYIAPYVFTADVPTELVAYVKEHGFTWARVELSVERVIRTDFAAHILGRTGLIPQEEAEHYKALGYKADDIVGVDGAEKAFERWLHGTTGTRAVETDKAGQERSVLYTKEPEPGKNVFLTIDILFQERVERILSRGIAELQASGEELKGKEAEAGAIVVMDVHSGEVLALASYPTYDLRAFSAQYSELLQDPLRPLVNRAIAGLYSPGSTYKMVTAAAALEEGVITPATKIRDMGKYTFFEDYQPRCHAYPGSHGNVNVREALKVSCNYFFYDIGRQAGYRALADRANKFGLGVYSGIELSGELAGYVAGPETAAKLGTFWFLGNTLSAAIGQSDNLFTPLQLANYAATIANGGNLYSAHLLREVKSADYLQTLYINTGIDYTPTGLSGSTIAALQDGMLMVTQPGGTAHAIFADFPVAVAAKTGSVQVGDSPNNGVFVAYAPANDPAVAVAVVIEKGGAGSRVAPIARDVLAAWFDLEAEYAG